MYAVSPFTYKMPDSIFNVSPAIATQRFTRSLPRFTEASLVKKLEELGIGRPSTYAPTISKITEKGRGYVVKESRDGRERNYQVLTLKDDKVAAVTKTETTGTEKNKLFPSDKGKLVVDSVTDTKITGSIDLTDGENSIKGSFTADAPKSK